MTRRRLISLLAATVMLAAVSARGRATAQERPAPHPDAAALDQAEEQKKRAIVAAGTLGPGHTGELAAAYAGLAEFYVEQERVTEANALLEQALVLLSETPRADFHVLNRVYQQLATIRRARNNKAEAESLLQLSLALCERRLGPDHLEVADALDRLAELRSWGDEASALALHRRAFAIRERHFGANPAEAITWLKKEAEWIQSQAPNEKDEAEAIWKRALALQERVLGPEHRDVADTLMKIVSVRVHLNERGNPFASLPLTKENMFPSGARQAEWAKSVQAWARASEPLLVRARAIREKALGPDHADTIKTIEYLAAGYLVRQDRARGAALYRRVLAAYEKTVAAGDPSLKGPLGALAACAMEEHRYRDAVPLLKRLAAFEAEEEAGKPKDAGPFDDVLKAMHDQTEPDDDRSYAAQLRKAIRYADLGLTAASFPTEEDLAFLKAEKWCPTNLDLDGLLGLTPMTAFGTHVDNAALRRLKGLINLKSLSLIPSGRPMGIGGTSPPFTAFEIDVVRGIVKPNIDDVGLAQLRNLTRLEELNLTATAIHGTGLAVLAKMSGLKELDLSWSEVDDAGLASLPALPNLERLDLSRTAVSDASLPVLKKLTGLKRLQIIRAKISEDGAAELRRATPGLELIGPVLRPSGSSKNEAK